MANDVLIYNVFEKCVGVVRMVEGCAILVAASLDKIDFGTDETRKSMPYIFQLRLNYLPLLF